MSEPWEDFAEDEGGVAVDETTPPWADFQPPEQQARRESLVQAMEEAKPGVGEQAIEAAPGVLESGINWFRENLERTVNAPVVLGKLVAPKIFPPNMELPIEFGKVPFTLRERQELVTTPEGIRRQGRIIDRALEAARFAGGPGVSGRQIAPPPSAVPPAFPPETQAEEEARQIETGAKVVGSGLAAYDLMRFFATPEGITTALATPIQLGRALLGAGFSAEMAAQVQEAAQQAGELEANATTPEEKAQATRAKFSLFANIVFPGLITGGAVKAGEIRPPRVGPIPMPETEAAMRREIDYPKALEEVRAQAEQGAELADARETLANQIAEAKASEASGKPLSENSLRIMAESLANAMGARLTRQKPKPRGGPSAVQVRGPETEVRGLPAQPGVHEGGVPAEVSAPGVPQRGVREEAGAAGDVPRPTPAGPAGGTVAAPPLAGDHYTIAALGLKRLGVSPGNADALLRGAKDVSEVVSEKNQVEATAILEKFDAAEQKIVEGKPLEEPPAPAAAPVKAEEVTPTAEAVTPPTSPVAGEPTSPIGASAQIAQVSGLTGTQFNEWARQQTGGFTTTADKLGDSISTPEELAVLKAAWDNARKRGEEAQAGPLNTDAQIEEAQGIGYQEQFFSEAYGRATGTGSAGEHAAKTVPGYKPKFQAEPETPTPEPSPAAAAAPEAKFLDIPESQWTPEKLRELIGKGNRKAILSAVNARLGLKGIHQVSAITIEPTLLKRIREVLGQMKKETTAKPTTPAEPAAPPEPVVPAEPASETPEVTPAAKPKPTFEELTAKREKEKADLIARNMAKVPDNATSVKLQDSSGKTAIVSRDIADPKKWRLTYYTTDGEPWGHAVLNTRDEAIQSALGIYGKTYGPPHLSRGYEVVEAKTPSVTEAPKTTLEAPKPSPGPAAVVQAERPPQPPVAQTKGPLKGPQQKKYLISEAQHALEQAPAQQRRVATDADSDQARLEQIEKSVREQVKGRPYGEGESEESLVAAQAGDLFTKYGIPEDYPAYSGQMSIEGKWAQEPRPAGKHGPGDRLRMLNEAIAREQFTKGDNITIEVPGDGTFVIRNSAPALKAFLERAKKFPTTVAKAPQPSQARTTPSHPSPVEKARTVESDVEAVQAFTSTDPTRFVLQFVMSDGKHLIATDGRKLVLVNRKGPGTEANPKFFDQEGKLHEYPTTPEALEQAKKDWEEARKKNKKLGKFEGPRFPNWQQVMPTETETWFRNLDTERLFRLAKQAQGVMTEKDRTITLFRDSEGRLGITSGPNDFGDYAADITATSRPLITLNGDYFLDMVDTARRLGLKKVDIGGTPKAEGKFPELEPVTMQGPGVKMILMPMRTVSGGESYKAAKAAGAQIPEPKTETEEPPTFTGPGAESLQDAVALEQREALRSGPQPPTRPPLTPEEESAIPPDDRIHVAIKEKDVLPMRDFWASPEFEFRQNPAAGSYVTRFLEAVLGFKARASRTNEALVKNLWDKLTEPDQIRVTKAMRDVYAGNPRAVSDLPDNLRNVADKTRDYLDLMRERIIETKTQDLIDSLPEARRGALLAIRDEGMLPADAFREFHLRDAGRRAVMDALEELTEIRTWGLDNYVTNIELGSYQIKTDSGTTVAIGETRTSAKAKALKYLEEHPEYDGGLTIDDSYSGPTDVPTKLSQGSYFRTVKKLADNLGTTAKRVQEALRSEGKPGIVVKPTSKYAGALQHRRGILAGEENLSDSLPSYIFSVEKKLALDPLLKEARTLLPKLPTNISKQLEALIDQGKGSKPISDQIADYLLSPFGIRPFAASRGVNLIRNISTVTKLGYRPISALVNRMGGLHATWTKAGTKWWWEGRKFRRTPEFQEIWDRNKDFVGWESTLSSVEGASHPVTKIYQPLGMFQLAERVNRPEAFATFYQQGLKSMDMTGRQAEAYARWMTRFTQNIYDPVALPRAMRGPAGRLVLQFKPYLVKHLEMLSTLRGHPDQMARYLTGFLALGGPRAAIFMLRSLPVLGAVGFLAGLEDWFNRKLPAASRGVGGAAGVDITAAVTPQLPTRPEDWMGPTLSDVYRLWKDVLGPAIRGERKDWKDITEWGSRLAPAAFYWRQMVDSALADNGWTEDPRGRLKFNPSLADKAKYALGAKPLKQSVQEVESRYLRETEAIFRKNRTHAIDEYITALDKGDATQAEKLRADLQEYGVTREMVLNAAKQRRIPPRARLFRYLSRETRRRESERWAEPDEE